MDLASCLDAPTYAELAACLRQWPAATPDELRVWLGRLVVSRATRGRTVAALN